jgi:formylmethanofuran dehydrogenase subunit B
VTPTLTSTMRFTTAVYGIHVRGTAYGMDEIPISLTAVLPTGYPTDADVLAQIAQRVG